MRKNITGNPEILNNPKKLETSLYSTKSINDYYKDPHTKWIVNDTSDIIGEEWTELKKDDVIIKVSTLGRIKRQDNKYLRLFEGGENKKFDYDLTRDVFEKVGENNVGWVCVMIKGKKYFVYHLVAEAWLDTPDGCQIHHITNDGYDNSIYNLICLSPAQHGMLNACKKQSGPYVPEYKKFL
ncbi:MAG: hypothetical protein J5613_01270 [Alphaproteobacteria bacterium]|nr:hypothetical protein [Alphaproteobacteria bacterium]